MSILVNKLLILILLFVKSSTSSVCKSATVNNFKVNCKPEGIWLDYFDLTIECQNFHSWQNFSWIPKQQLQIATLKFITCTFPPDLSLFKLAKSHNLTKAPISFLNFINSPISWKNIQEFELINRIYFTGSKKANTTVVADDVLHGMEIRSFYFYYPTNWQTIPSCFFKDSKLLWDITIQSGGLKMIRQRDFEGLENLEVLHLEYNQIETIDTGTFDGLGSLTKIYMEHNKLKTLPYRLFKKLPNLQFLLLSHNRLMQLPADLFHPRSNLYFLGLDHNSLGSLPRDAFSCLEQLHYINLSNNVLYSLPSNLFNFNKNLNQIWLDHNALKTLPGKIFKSIVTPWINIYLDHNQLTNLTEDVFIGVDIHLLQLSHNRLTSIGPICELENTITITKFKSKKCATVRRLFLNNNLIQQIFHDWKFLSLETLDLENNLVTDIDADSLNETFGPDLKLNLRNNKINAVALNAMQQKINFSNKSYKFILDNIKLESNRFTCDCKLINFIKYIREKEPIFNKYHQEMYCFEPANLKNMLLYEIDTRELKCLYQPIKADDACNDLCTCHSYPEKKILLVDCSYRNLSQIPQIIGSSNNYSIELNMSGNYLYEAPKLNCSVNLLRIILIDLSRNNITNVPIELFSSNASDVKLHSNHILRLEPEVINYLLNHKKLSNLTLHDNKWICDCKSLGFLKLVQQNVARFNFYQVRCKHNLKQLHQIQFDEFCLSSIRIITVVLVFFGSSVGLLAIIYYKYQIEIKVWMYSKQCCFWPAMKKDEEDVKTCDAFTQEDNLSVANEVAPNLEKKLMDFKSSFHHRSWITYNGYQLLPFRQEK